MSKILSVVEFPPGSVLKNQQLQYECVACGLNDQYLLGPISKSIDISVMRGIQHKRYVSWRSHGEIKKNRQNFCSSKCLISLRNWINCEKLLPSILLICLSRRPMHVIFLCIFIPNVVFMTLNNISIAHETTCLTVVTVKYSQNLVVLPTTNTPEFLNFPAPETAIPRTHFSYF